MRLIAEFKDDREAQSFSSLLQTKKIENMVEMAKVSDWSSVDYGTIQCKVWIWDEDRLDEALSLYREFIGNPDLVGEHLPKKQPVVEKRKLKASAAIRPKGNLTLFFLILCTALFFGNLFLMPNLPKLPKGLPEIALLHTPISEVLWFDYPKAWELVDKLEKAYGVQALLKPELLPESGQVIWKMAETTPVFEGFYSKIVAYLKEGTPITPGAPLFEKISEGEVWRAFTPCLMHFDVIHLFFNMIWLFILGVQIEGRIFGARYLFFILITGIFSNVLQYLMSGPNFIGFSGVLCAMIMYVWIRQKRAPWEGYQLLPITMGFITVFVVAMFLIQSVSFFLEVFGSGAIPVQIANTAHLSGALIGGLLAFVPYFGWKRS